MFATGSTPAPIFMSGGLSGHSELDSEFLVNIHSQLHEYILHWFCNVVKTKSVNFITKIYLNV